MPVLRHPADQAFLANRLAQVRWLEEPAGRATRRLVETCRAELEWATAEWRRQNPGGDPYRSWGPHPAEACRLPHEQAAARLVNCHIHLDCHAWRLNDLRRRVRSQRLAATDTTQSEAYRAAWAEALERGIIDWRRQLRARRAARQAFQAAEADYRGLRAAVDRGPLDALGAAAHIGRAAA